HACAAALDVARRMLRDSEPGGGGVLRLDGSALTSERIKAEMQQVFIAHGAIADEFIVASGAQGAVGHDMGSGPISAGVPVVFDLWPRDTETAVYTDVTRTYVVGDVPDEIRQYHRLCKDALERTTAAARPGVNGRELMQIACDLFAEHGYPTQLTKKPGEVLDSGFFHGLGHGVGLEVHERPRLSVVGDDLVPGDVITLEPGLYRAGYGGVRLEDILLVTDDRRGAAGRCREGGGQNGCSRPGPARHAHRRRAGGRPGTARPRCVRADHVPAQRPRSEFHPGRDLDRPRALLRRDRAVACRNVGVPAP